MWLEIYTLEATEMTRSRNLTWVVVATAVLMVASTNLAGAWHHEDTPLHLAQNKLLEEAGADDAWTTPAEEHACYKGISYLTSGKNVAKLGPRIVPLLYDSLIDERYLNQHEVTDANGERVTVQAYTANGKFGYRYCIWLVAVRILSDQIYDDMREKFIVHLTGIAGTPRPSYHGAGFCDIILYESMETLGAFPSDTANDALLRVMRDQTKKDEARVYAAGFLVNCKVPVISNEAKQYILSEYGMRTANIRGIPWTLRCGRWGTTRSERNWLKGMRKTVLRVRLFSTYTKVIPNRQKESR